MIHNITSEFLGLIKKTPKNNEKDTKLLNHLVVMPMIAPGMVAMMMPTGILMVSAALKASGRNVMTFNMNYRGGGDSERIKQLVDYITRENIDVVWTGGLSTSFWAVKEILDTAKKATKLLGKNIVTVAGGG